MRGNKMANKESKISVSALKKIINDHYPQSCEAEFNGIDIKINKTISLESMIAFVTDVVENCTSEGYIPEIEDFLIRCNILERYANFTLPDDVSKRYEMVYATDAVEFVLDRINIAQFSDIKRSIRDKIDYFVNTDMSAATREFNSALDTFEGLQNIMAGAFDGVSPEDINAVIKAIAENGKVDEEKIVGALMKQKE